MTDTIRPVLDQLSLVVQDLPRALAFYRRLGLTVQEAAHPDWSRHHASAVLVNGMRLELDSMAFAQQWNPGLSRATGRPSGSVLFFQVADREDVDRLFATMVEAGYAAQKSPEDAFWGARYAIIEDPDGHAVGIMSPIDPARKTAPPPAPGSRPA